MTSFLGILSELLYNPKTAIFKILFTQKFNIWTTNKKLPNKFAIYESIQYKVLNNKNHGLQHYIRINFGELKVKHFDQLENTTRARVKNYFHLHQY